MAGRGAVIEEVGDSVGVAVRGSRPAREAVSVIEVLPRDTVRLHRAPKSMDENVLKGAGILCAGKDRDRIDATIDRLLATGATHDLI
jgi:hypothetical protein